MLPRDRGTIVQVGSALGLPRHPAAVGVLRRQARDPGLPRVAARASCCTTAATCTSRWCRCRRSTPRSSPGCCPGCPTRPSRCRRSTSPRSPRGRSLYAADHPRRREYWVGAQHGGDAVANAVAPGPAGPLPRAHRLRVPADRRAAATRTAGEPVEPADGPAAGTMAATESSTGVPIASRLRSWASQHAGRLSP